MSTQAGLLALLLPIVLAEPAVTHQVWLRADFNDKAIDQPIGMGGPELGEPVGTSQGPLDAIVRATPMPTPCLEITDQSESYAGSVRFQFLDDAEIQEGLLYIRADFWIPQVPQGGYGLGVRERDGAAHKFIQLTFGHSGKVTCSDEGGVVGLVAPYQVGRVTPICIAFDMTAGTYDLWIDGNLVVADQPHDVTGAGIGSVLVSFGSDSDVGDAFYVDNLFVGDYDITPTKSTTWGAVKALFRSGPAGP
jgi:hypothetical protein